MLSVPGASFMVLSITVTRAAAIVLTILAIFPAVLTAVFAPIFTSILATVFSTIFAARRLIGLASQRGGGEQGAGNEQRGPQL
jgi:hypothetical protein